MWPPVLPKSGAVCACGYAANLLSCLFILSATVSMLFVGWQACFLGCSVFDSCDTADDQAAFLLSRAESVPSNSPHTRSATHCCQVGVYLDVCQGFLFVIDGLVSKEASGTLRTGPTKAGGSTQTTFTGRLRVAVCPCKMSWLFGKHQQQPVSDGHLACQEPSACSNDSKPVASSYVTLLPKRAGSAW